ncbi:PepSY domain-containing protein [Pseudomonas sp. dw_358]|uniref:PepSY domain-containing protein n=1 Tax=Pseudomonas sp. dw_358 TaxID=2720083 RepID=UPI001BD3602F|nr:PepSY domain-containing protein [Pseudomonas sp. dw_358]
MRIALTALLVLGMSTTASARDLNQDEALRLRQQGLILPFEQLLEQAMALYPGARLLEAELEEHDDRYVYEVELLTPAKVVREIKVDASNGQVLADKEDD